VRSQTDFHNDRALIRLAMANQLSMEQDGATRSQTACLVPKLRLECSQGHSRISSSAVPPPPPPTLHHPIGRFTITLQLCNVVNKGVPFPYIRMEKITVLWDVTPRSIVNMYRRFGKKNLCDIFGFIFILSPIFLAAVSKLLIASWNAMEIKLNTCK
jgi:hypothetical protein